MADSNATQAGFDGSVIVGLMPRTRLKMGGYSSFEKIKDSASRKTCPSGVLAWTREDRRLFYCNDEGKLYELTFTEVENA